MEYFPILNLAYDIRAMIYRHALAPTGFTNIERAPHGSATFSYHTVAAFTVNTKLCHHFATTIFALNVMQTDI